MKNIVVIGLVVVIKQFKNLIYHNISTSNTLKQIDQQILSAIGLDVILVTLLRRVYGYTKLVIILMKAKLGAIGLVVVIKQLKNLIYQDTSISNTVKIDHGNSNVIGLDVVLVTFLM